jgi:hypothetical protein
MPPIGEAPHVQLEPQGLDSWWWRPWGRKVVMALVLYASIVNIYIYIYVYIYMYILLYFVLQLLQEAKKKRGGKGAQSNGSALESSTPCRHSKMRVTTVRASQTVFGS